MTNALAYYIAASVMGVERFYSTGIWIEPVILVSNRTQLDWVLIKGHIGKKGMALS